MPDNDMDQRVKAIQQLLNIFKIERAVYLTVTVISLVMLLSSAAVVIYKGTAGPLEVTGLFGSAGAITYTAGRLLRMWSEALRVLYPVAREDK